MYNNYNNDNFNNNPKPLFSNEFPSMEINNNNVFSNQNNLAKPSQDIPPILEPIKNLSDASIVNAPTLDVLDPMNIMPESFENKESAKVDPLDAYDNGINYGSTINSSTNNELFNASPSFEQVQNIVNTIEQTPVSTEISNIENNLVTNPVSLDIPNLENNVDTKTPSFEIPDLGDFDNNIFNSVNPVINNVNTIDISTQGKEEKNEFDIKPIINESSINNLGIEPNIDFNMSEEKPSKELVNENSSYEIIQDKIEPENSMLNLGIDNAYDDIDMLDIVDIDEENKEESNNIEEHKHSEEDDKLEEKPLIVDNINEIRELINKIKEKGIKIELEEFDFEHMYQLIVKIEK